MFDKITERTQTVLNFAFEEASRLQHRNVGTPHVLLGMIREGNGVAGHVLAESGVAGRKILEFLAEPEFAPGESDTELSELDATSQHEAIWLDHKYVGTEHLLLGLCSMADSKAVKMLLRIGVRPREVCHNVVDILGHFDEWDRWLSDHPATP